MGFRGRGSKGVLNVSEVDADRGGRRCRAWAVGLGPWRGTFWVGAVGVGVGAALSCAASVDVRGSRCRDKACCVAGEEEKVWDRVGSKGRSGSRS